MISALIVSEIFAVRNTRINVWKHYTLLTCEQCVCDQIWSKKIFEKLEDSYATAQDRCMRHMDEPNTCSVEFSLYSSMSGHGYINKHLRHIGKAA